MIGVALIFRQSTTWSNQDKSLSAFEINRTARERLEQERNKLDRVSLLGDCLSYDDVSDQGIDGNESAREFLSTIEVFVASKAYDVLFARQRVRELSKDCENSFSKVSSPKGMYEH